MQRGGAEHKRGKLRQKHIYVEYAAVGEEEMLGAKEKESFSSCARGNTPAQRSVKCENLFNELT